ncbi:MAG: HEPN domain-containing protein [Deltaproteobacteria bacterium]|nr:HEPN domain-containing protein [Deltaproteobacteria bacterium]
MELQKIIAFWKKSAGLDKKTSEDLFKSKNYVGCLFFVHLYLEKILKGLVQKTTRETPPFIHDLLILSKIAGVELTEEQKDSLTTINTFNIRTRYLDYKLSFYKKATREYAAKYVKITEDLYQWFLNRY